ncbi:MAG: pyridoxamine 5'-phosphate oxidase family protein [Patescibacteria group bacterium]
MNEGLTEKIKEFLKADTDKLGVIATVSGEEKSESAFVYYTFDEKLNIYLLTHLESRKHKNIMAHPDVSFAVAFTNPPQTIQIEGHASIVTDAHDVHEFFSKLVEMVAAKSVIPPVSKMNMGEVVFVKIEPTWVRFGDFSRGIGQDVFQEMFL